MGPSPTTPTPLHPLLPGRGTGLCFVLPVMRNFNTTRARARATPRTRKEDQTRWQPVLFIHGARLCVCAPAVFLFLVVRPRSRAAACALARQGKPWLTNARQVPHARKMTCPGTPPPAASLPCHAFGPAPTRCSVPTVCSLCASTALLRVARTSTRSTRNRVVSGCRKARPARKEQNYPYSTCSTCSTCSTYSSCPPSRHCPLRHADRGARSWRGWVPQWLDRRRDLVSAPF